MKNADRQKICDTFNEYSNQEWLTNGMPKKIESVPSIFGWDTSYPEDVVVVSGYTSDLGVDYLKPLMEPFGLSLTDISKPKIEKNSTMHTARLCAKYPVADTIQRIQEAESPLHQKFYERELPGKIRHIASSVRGAIDRLVPVKDTPESQLLIQRLEQHASETLQDHATHDGFNEKNQHFGVSSAFSEPLLVPPSEGKLNNAFAIIDGDIGLDLLWLQHKTYNTNKSIESGLKQKLINQLKELSAAFEKPPEQSGQISTTELSDIEGKGRVSGNGKERPGNPADRVFY